MPSPSRPARSRTRGARTTIGPMPVTISRSGRWPWRTKRRRPSSVSLSAWFPRNAATSASMAWARRERAPLRSTSVSGSENVPGWESLKTLLSVTAYRSFGGEVEARTPPRYAAFTPSRRHQLPPIAPKPGSGPSADRRSLSDAVASLFDVDYYVETYMPASSGAISREEAIDHFIGNGFSKGIVPVAGEQFDEAFYLMYYPDIRAAKAEGTIPSGYAHYISTGRQEGRLPTHDLGRVLEAKLGLLAYPVGINRVSSLRARLRPISVQIAHGRRPVVNVFVPSIDPDLIFGGYIAFFHFLCRLS